MADLGLLERGVALSYYIEGLLSNIANVDSYPTRESTFVNCLRYCASHDLTQFTCANGIHYLIRDGHDVCWPSAQCAAFLSAATSFWDRAGR